MPKHSLNHLQENLLRMIVEDGPAFQTRFGRTTRVYFEQLPLLFGLFRHLALDLDLSPKARQLAATAALYIAEPDDFLRAESTGTMGLLDDIWVAFATLRALRNTINNDERIQRKLRVESDWPHLVSLVENLEPIVEVMPTRVLEKLRLLIGVED
jgi:uncharacterized membrane protein YkvA (DUF1232 family)